MKTKSPRQHAPDWQEKEEIRAYAAHLYEQGGRISDQDIANWLEAQGGWRVGTEPRRRRAAGRRRIRGFTMPPSDASLWLDEIEGG